MLWKEYTTSYSRSFQNHSFSYFADSAVWKHSFIHKPTKYVKQAIILKTPGSEEESGPWFSKNVVFSIEVKN